MLCDRPASTVCEARTIALARQLEAAGAMTITVHGRTRSQGGGRRTGKWPANWGWISAVKRAVRRPRARAPSSTAFAR